MIEGQLMWSATQTIFEEGVYHHLLDDDGKMPVSLVLPQAYEPRYAYPLLVFLHGHGEEETQWIDAVWSLSRRNYICIGLRGPNQVERKDGRKGFSWGRNRRCDGLLEDYILSATRETMRVCHVHSERIFLAGFCEGATVAYRLGLSFPDKFAGIVALNGWLPTGTLPFFDARAHFPLRVFIGHGIKNSVVAPIEAKKCHRLLYSAGFSVELRYYATGHRLHPAMLRDVNHWLIEQC